MKTKDGSNQQDDAGKPTNKRKFEYGFTSMDNRLFYLQQDLTPAEFSVLIRVYRATEGYDGRPKALSGSYFQEVCNMSKNTVSSAIKGLEGKELIYVKRRQKATSFYLVNLEKMDDMYQEIKRSIIEDFEIMTSEDDQSGSDIGNQNGDNDNLDSQNLTKTWSKSDHLIPKIRPCDGQILGTNKEKYKEKLKEKNKEKIYSDSSKEKDIDKSKTKKPAVKKETYDALTFAIPFFIEQEDWIGFVEMRVATKKPLTERACKILVNKLTKWHEQGLDIQSAIHQSILKNYSDVYEPKRNLPATNNQQGYNNGQQQSDSQPATSADLYQQQLREQFGLSSEPLRTVN